MAVKYNPKHARTFELWIRQPGAAKANDTRRN